MNSKNTSFFLAILSLAVLLSFTFFVNSVYADCGGVKTAILDCSESGTGSDGDLANSGIVGILKLVIIILTSAVGLAAVGGIAYGAVLYASAQDNQSQVQKAIEIIRNVVIGIIAYAAMFSFLNFLIPGGVL